MTAAPSPLCVIRFCVSHSKTCDKDSAATAEECQAAMASTATVVTTVASAARNRTEESGGGGGTTAGAAVRNMMMSAADGGGDIVTVTTVSKAIRPWDIATVVSSGEKRWVLCVVRPT